jgi:hypothetical protein
MGLYKRLLATGKAAIEAIELPFKVKAEQKGLEMKILKLEEQIAKDELAIQQQKSTNPIDWDALGNAIDRKVLTERRLKQYQDLNVELFGEEKEAEKA